MNRVVLTFAAALMLALSGVIGVGPAHAQFPTPCNFTLSPPQVVQVSGADMVTVTMTPAGCMGPFHPSMSVACVQLQGAGTQCSQGRGSDTAQVYTPYKPGATYISTGRGTSAFFGDMNEPNWQVLGPISATL